MNYFKNTLLLFVVTTCFSTISYAAAERSFDKRRPVYVHTSKLAADGANWAAPVGSMIGAWYAFNMFDSRAKHASIDSKGNLNLWSYCVCLLPAIWAGSLVGVKVAQLAGGAVGGAVGFCGDMVEELCNLRTQPVVHSAEALVESSRGRA